MKITINENIEMRSPVAADAKEIFSVIDGNREYLRQWLPWLDSTTSEEITEGVIASWEKKLDAGTDVVLGIFKDGVYIGNIGLHDLKAYNSSGMIGYWLAEAEQGVGIMTACVRALIGYGFETLYLNRVYIHCAVPNKKSRAVPERLGFVQEGILRDGEYLYGKYFDMVVYGLLKTDVIKSNLRDFYNHEAGHRDLGKKQDWKIRQRDER